MANIKVPLSEDLKLCINDARLICECLNMAKTTLKEVKPANIVVEQTIKHKINRIDKVLPIIERSAQYDFDESVRRCQSGQCKRENIGDVGQDTFTIMANRKGNSKDKETKIVKNKSSRRKNKKKNTYSDQ